MKKFSRILLRKWGVFPLWGLLILVLSAYPSTGASSIDLFTATQVFLWVTLASNWNLIGGMTGYLDFGHAVFFGIGAYTMGILVTNTSLAFSPNLSFWQALPWTGLVSVIFALLIGWATLRLKGPYFSIAMLSTFAATRELIRILRPITGGGSGLDLPPVLNRVGDYYFMLILMAIVVSLMGWIRRSKLGMSLVAIREDEIGAEMRGINTTFHKLFAFAVAAFFTGLCGAFWAWQNTYIDPDVVFLQNRNILMIMMCMLGGLGTVWGPVIGALILYLLQDSLWSNLADYHLLVLGILLILIILFVPYGIIGTLKNNNISFLELLNLGNKTKAKFK
ncbi:MAG: branched-chain amino acid ABC transporter permease [Xenococcaceae cyanobacterium MO_188.B19]|nr:branched-chain amino acid ABC transporter permease [Xenococcaceae cyanobacterium MO_188.B19]